MWLHRYQSEVQRLRNVFRTAVAGDVARLKDAVAGYKENTSRLECQKQLLLKQVRVFKMHRLHLSESFGCTGPAQRVRRTVLGTVQLDAICCCMPIGA